MSRVKAEECFREFLIELGLDMNDPNLVDTPERVTRMYLDELFIGIEESSLPPIMTMFPNEDNKFDEIILLTNINFVSVCAHHLCFFQGFAHFAYLPGDNIVGLSKIARLIDYYCCRPQIQEALTQQIVDSFMLILQPKGCMLIMEANHTCISCRGIRSSLDTKMITSAIRGVFQENPSLKEEALKLMKG